MKSWINIKLTIYVLFIPRHCDGIVMFHNDEVMYRLQRRYKSHDTNISISIPKMNDHIAACLAGIFLPIDSITPKR